MIGPLLGPMLDAADAEATARLRQRFFADVDGEITAEHVAAAMPGILFAVWAEHEGKGLPTGPEIEALIAEHGQEAGMSLLRERFLDFVRRKVGGAA